MNEGKLSRREFMRDGAIVASSLAVGLGSVGCQSVRVGNTGNVSASVKNTRSYNPDMNYRRLGKTELWVSAVCLGGHWKRVDKMVPDVFRGKGWLNADINSEGFRRNRRDVVSCCIDHGINYIDACTWQEIHAYSEALKGRRDSMFLGFSWYQDEMRNKSYRKSGKLLATLDKGMQLCNLDYVDLWRITMIAESSRHTDAEIDEMMNALEKARKQGKVRFTGCSSHDRPHIARMIETYPDVIQVVVTPYTAKTKSLPKDSMFDILKKHDVGMFGIKPFASNSLFSGDSSLGNPSQKEDDEKARLAIRHILNNPSVTAPIPGLINTHQVKNMALAIKEYREHDLDKAEARKLEKAMDRAWANLPRHYQWLKDWEYV